MADDNGGRVEMRLSMTTSGLKGSPEHIEILRQRQEEAERLSRRGPPGAFARALGAAGSSQAAKLPGRRPLRRGPVPSGRRLAADGGGHELGDDDLTVGSGGKVIIRP